MSFRCYREGLEIYTVEMYLKVRRAHFHDGLSERAIARDFGISRDSVAKMLAYSEPPGYRRTAPIKRPKLDGFTDQIDIRSASNPIGTMYHTTPRGSVCVSKCVRGVV